MELLIWYVISTSLISAGFKMYRTQGNE